MRTASTPKPITEVPDHEYTNKRARDHAHNLGLEFNDDEIITTPGKFEGERIAVPFFWEQYLNGGSDKDDGEIIYFILSPREKRELQTNRKYFKLHERTDGFVIEINN